MSANSLLLWMSARRHGSWAQFRAAVEELHLGADVEAEGEGDDAPDQFALPLYQTLRLNLQRVGYAEFFAGAGEGAEWRVTPPALAITRREHGRLGVVVGARSLALVDRLRSATASHAAEHRVLALESYPDHILITANSRDNLAAIADQAGLFLQNDAPATLLASLPPVDDPRVTLLAFAALAGEKTVPFQRFGLVGLVGLMRSNRSITVPRRTAARHSPSSPVGSTS